MMIDVLFADFPNVENSSEKITVCFGLFGLGILRETSSRYFFVEPPLFRMCIWMLLVNWFGVLSVRMGESESFAFPKPEWLSFALFGIGGEY